VSAMTWQRGKKTRVRVGKDGSSPSGGGGGGGVGKEPWTVRSRFGKKDERGVQKGGKTTSRGFEGGEFPDVTGTSLEQYPSACPYVPLFYPRAYTLSCPERRNDAMVKGDDKGSFLRRYCSRERRCTKPWEESHWRRGGRARWEV